MELDIKKLIVKFGWIEGLSVKAVNKYCQLYDELGIHGKVIGNVDDVIVELLVNGWVEKINKNVHNKDVYRCVPVRKLVLKFKEDLDEFYDKNMGILKELIDGVGIEGEYVADTRRDVYLYERSDDKVL